MNVYESESNRQNYLSKYFTADGIKSLETRLKQLSKLYVEVKTYPFKAMMFGFPTLIIKNKEQHFGMMEELRQILGLSEIIFEVNT